jgi:hypothetical protein
MKRHIFALIFLATAIVSCKKEPGIVSGSNSLVYESDAFVSVKTNFSAISNTAELEVDNVNPYNHMIGDVMSTGLQATINDKGVAISNVQITDIKISSLELYCPYNLSDFSDYLTDCEVLLQYLNTSANWVTSELGTFSQVSNSSSKVLFNITNDDLTTFMKNKPNRIVFRFNFNGVPPSELEVKYKLSFDYNYTYESSELE